MLERKLSGDLQSNTKHGSCLGARKATIPLPAKSTTQPLLSRCRDLSSQDGKRRFIAPHSAYVCSGRTSYEAASQERTYADPQVCDGGLALLRRGNGGRPHPEAGTL